MIKPQYVNMAVSKEFGLEAYQIFDEPITSETFVQIFNEINKNGTNYTGLCDNGSWHKSKYTRNILMTCGMKLCYNLVKFPVLNPIENVFSVLKNTFKRHKLNLI